MDHEMEKIQQKLQLQHTMIVAQHNSDSLEVTNLLFASVLLRTCYLYRQP